MTTSIYSDPEAARIGHANLRAEQRAVESGRTCRFDSERGLLVVKSSDGSHDYHLRVTAVDGLLVVLCTCPAGFSAETGTHRPARPGVLPCWHGAKAARFFERKGLARFDGIRWRTSRKADRLAS